jgi:hypothetical protein
MNGGDYAAAQELYDVAFELLERDQPGQPLRDEAEGRAATFRVSMFEPETLDPGLAATNEVLLVERGEDIARCGVVDDIVGAARASRAAGGEAARTHLGKQKRLSIQAAA